MVGEHASRHGQKVVTGTLVSLGLLPGPPPPAAPAPGPRRRRRRTLLSPASGPPPRSVRTSAHVAADDPAYDAPHPDNRPVATDVLRSRAGYRPDPAPPSANGGHGVSAADGFVLDSAELAIPGYDSLSASQVVQRLAGLAPPELEAVRTYEAADRGRRTNLDQDLTAPDRAVLSRWRGPAGHGRRRDPAGGAVPAGQGGSAGVPGRRPAVPPRGPAGSGRAVVARRDGDPDRAMWVGTIDDFVVGYAAGRIEQLPDGERLGVIEDLFVEPEARSVGVGEALANRSSPGSRTRAVRGPTPWPCRAPGRPRTSSRSRVSRPGCSSCTGGSKAMAEHPEVCVGAMAVADDQLLMIRRGHGPAAGRWSVPGGRVERGGDPGGGGGPGAGRGDRPRGDVRRVRRLGGAHRRGLPLPDPRLRGDGAVHRCARGGDDAAEAAGCPWSTWPRCRWSTAWPSSCTSTGSSRPSPDRVPRRSF